MTKTEDSARRIRISALKTVHRAGASHIGSALSIVDLLAVLYGRCLQVKPENPGYGDRDRLILSKGHACVALYATLADQGFFPAGELDTYGADFSRLMQHSSHLVPGVEFSTGSLGHGLPFGAGRALAAKQRQEAWRTVVIMSDGELGEGSNWEACLFAAHHGLDNLIAIIDYNNLQSLTTVDQTLNIEPLREKFEAFGWSVQSIDGHDHAAIAAAYDKASPGAGRPHVIVAKTTKGKGVSFMENKVEWHYKCPSSEQLSLALAELEGAHA